MVHPFCEENKLGSCYFKKMSVEIILFELPCWVCCWLICEPVCSFSEIFEVHHNSQLFKTINNFCNFVLFKIKIIGCVFTLLVCSLHSLLMTQRNTLFILSNVHMYSWIYYKNIDMKKTLKIFWSLKFGLYGVNLTVCLLLSEKSKYMY